MTLGKQHWTAKTSTVWHHQPPGGDSTNWTWSQVSAWRAARCDANSYSQSALASRGPCDFSPTRHRDVITVNRCKYPSHGRTAFSPVGGLVSSDWRAEYVQLVQPSPKPEHGLDKCCVLVSACVCLVPKQIIHHVLVIFLTSLGQVARRKHNDVIHAVVVVT